MKQFFSKISKKASDAAGQAKDFGSKISDKAAFSAQKVSELTAKAVSVVAENMEKYAEYFSESELWDKLKKFGKKLGSGILYPVVLLFNAMKSDSTPLKYKSLIVATLGYFILPVDLIPDVFAGIGFTDDAAAIMACLASVRKILTPEVYQQTGQRIKEMFGDVDEEMLREMVEKADQLVEKKVSEK